jgi:hypothetical protein
VVMGNFIGEQHTLAEWQTFTNWNQINKHYLHYNSFADCLCPLRMIICNLVSDGQSSRKAESDMSSVLKAYFSGFHRRCWDTTFIFTVYKLYIQFPCIQKRLDN